MIDELDTFVSKLLKGGVIMQPAHLSMLMLMGQKKESSDDWDLMQLLTESFIQLGKRVLANAKEDIDRFSPDDLGLVGYWQVNQSFRVTWKVSISK